MKIILSLISTIKPNLYNFNSTIKLKPKPKPKLVSHGFKFPLSPHLLVYCVSRFLSSRLLNGNPSLASIFWRFQFINDNPSAFVNANLEQQSLCLPSFVSSSPQNILILTKGGWFSSGICAPFLWLPCIIIQCKD